MFANGRADQHEIKGKLVEVKRAEPKEHEQRRGGQDSPGTGTSTSRGGSRTSSKSSPSVPTATPSNPHSPGRRSGAINQRGNGSFARTLSSNMSSVAGSQQAQALSNEEALKQARLIQKQKDDEEYV